MIQVHQKLRRDYCLARRSQRKFLVDLKASPSEVLIAQRKPFVCAFKIRKVKSTRRKFVPRRNIQKLHEVSVKNDSSSYINKDRKGVFEQMLEGYWNSLNRALLQATYRSCGWLKRPARHRETWCWNDDGRNSVSQKCELWKE